MSRRVVKSVPREGCAGAMYIGYPLPYVHFWAEIVNRAGVPSAEGSQFHLHPSGSAGRTLPGEDLGKFGLEKAILGYVRPF